MEVNQVTFSEDGNLFLTSSNDNTIRVWHTKTGACITTYNKHSLKILKAIFIEIKGRDETFIATASADNTAHIFNAWTGEQIYVYENENNSIVEIAWNKFNNSLIICDTYGEIVEYDLKKGKPKFTTKVFNWDGGIVSVPYHHQQVSGRGIYFYASKGGNGITTFSGKKNWKWFGFKESIADNERILKLAYNPKQSVLAIAKTTTEIAFHGLDTNLYKEIKLDDVALNGNRYEKESIKDIRFVDDTKIVVVTNTKFYQIDISDFSIETLFSTDNIGSAYIGLSTILFSTELDDLTYRSYLYDVSSNATIDSINHQWKPLNHLMGYNDSLKTYFFMAEEEIFVWKENGDQFKHRIIDFRNRLEKKEIHFDGTFLNQLDLSTGRFFPNRIITKSFWNIVDTIVLNKFKNPNYKEAEYESSNNPKYVYPIQENIMQTFVYEDPNYGTILQAPDEKTTTVIYPMLTLDVRGSMYESKSSERYGTNPSADDYVKNRFLEPHYSHNSAIYSENSKFLYATGIDKNIYKYDLTKINKVKVGGKDSDIFYVNRAELSYFEGHQDIPTYLDLSSDGFQLASCGLDNKIILWDT
jgi:WD40 repeat protein